jgi:N4-gp56 family major capsid protein
MGAITTTSTNSEAVKILYSKEFLTPFEENLRIYELGQKAPVPLNAGEGKTVEHTRWLQLDRPTTALSEDVTSTANPASRSFITQKVQTTLSVWGDYIDIMDYYKFVNIDPSLRVGAKILGNQASETLEEQVAVAWGAKGGIPMRSDGDAAYEKHFVPVTTGSLTIPTCSSLTEAADYWNGARYVPDNPMAGGFAEGRTVSDFASGALTLNATHSKITTTSTTVSLAVPTGLTDVISGAAIKRAVRMLRHLRAPYYKSGAYMCIIDPWQEYDLTNDTDFKNIQWNQQGGSGIEKYVIKRIWGVDIVVGSIPFRFDIAAPLTYAKTGAIHSAGIFGSDCFGVVEAKGQGMKMIFKDASQLGDPLDRHSTMGWKVFWAIALLNSCASVNLMTAATS